MSTILCDPNSLKCVFGLCSECKLFSNFDKLEIPSLKCSKSCFMKNEKCSEEGHTVKIQQFERVKYIHKGKEKKKIQLIDKHLKLTELCELFKDKLRNFPRHRYNVAHTAKTYDQLIENLTENMILKIHNFSENYTCLVPHEIQSLHWTQEQATVYPVVVLRRVNDVIWEDHITFISSDLKHDVPFVEFCNDLLHEYYKSEGYNITHDIEYNDGYSSQFKCIKAFSSLARRNIKTTRIFCETSHGKSKSDGLGGVIKSFVYHNVCGSENIIRNTKELYDYFIENLTVHNVENGKPMLNRLFFYISSEEMTEYRSSFPINKYKSIKGTLKIHQVTTTSNDKSIMARQCSCGCKSCLNNEEACESIAAFRLGAFDFATVT